MKRRLFLHRSLPLLACPLASLAAVPKARALARTSRPTQGIATPDGQARDHERIVVGQVPILFKVLDKDTDGDMAAFVSSNNVPGFGPPLHVHHSIDEFFCVLAGEFAFQVGAEQARLHPGDTILIPRNVPHAFDCVSAQPGKLLVTMQPANHMANFFRQLAQLLPSTGTPDLEAIKKLYQAHDSTIVGPPLRLK